MVYTAYISHLVKNLCVSIWLFYAFCIIFATEISTPNALFVIAFGKDTHNERYV